MVCGFASFMTNICIRLTCVFRDLGVFDHVIMVSRPPILCFMENVDYKVYIHSIFYLHNYVNTININIVKMNGWLDR